jgi:prolyl oligopeptidase
VIPRTLAWGLAGIAMTCLAPAFAAGIPPPDTPVDATIESHFGRTVYDPYRWLEETASSEVGDWFHAQNDHARRVLDALPGRPALAARLAELDAHRVRVKDVQAAGNQYFYLRQMPGERCYRLYSRDIATGAEELQVDPDRYAQGAESVAIAGFRASPNGQRIAFLLGVDGGDAPTLHVIDAATHAPSGAPILRAGPAVPAWRFDSTILFYTRQAGRAEAGSDAAAPARSVWMRTFGAGAPDGDVEIFGSGLHPDVPVALDGMPSVRVSPVSPYAIAVVQHGTRRELSLYVVALTRMRGAATPWRRLAGPDDGVTDFALRGEYIYLLTHKDAPRFSIVRWSLNEVRPLLVADAEVVVAPSERILHSLSVAKDALYVTAAEAGVGRLLRLEYNVKLKRTPAPAARGRTRRGTPSAPAALPKTAGIARGADVRLPFAGSIEALATDPLRPGALARLAGWTDPASYFAIDGKTGTAVRTALLPPAGADWSSVATAEVFVRSHDGASVPLSIVFGRTAARDGSAPLLLEAFGAFGANRGPAFWPPLLAWLERGGVYAVAHVRGGGELGAQWHRDGTRSAKANSWLDLIAAADWLVGARWTTPARLAALGRGAGALAVANAMIARPELFAAIASEDGLHDALRNESGVAGTANVTEFGTVTTAEGFRDLAAMSSYARIVDGVPYPAALLQTRFRDSRVDAWDAGKMAARLQAASAMEGGSGKPVLLSVSFAASLRATATTIDDDADLFSFLFWQTGRPGFAEP